MHLLSLFESVCTGSRIQRSFQPCSCYTIRRHLKGADHQSGGPLRGPAWQPNIVKVTAAQVKENLMNSSYHMRVSVEAEED